VVSEHVANPSTTGMKATGSTSSVQQVVPTPMPAAFYPVRGNWWTGCGSWRHLTQGEHAGKFDSRWLQSLSGAEIQSLHSDDHDGRVKWQYVVRPGQYRSIAAQKTDVPFKLVGYQPSPPVPAPDYAPAPAPAEAPKLRDSAGTEWQESPPTILSKPFYSVGPPTVAAPPPTVLFSSPCPPTVTYSSPVVTSTVRTYYAPRMYASGSYGYVNTYSGGMLVSN